MSLSWLNFLLPETYEQRLAASEKTIEHYHAELDRSRLSTDLLHALETTLGNQDGTRALFGQHAISDESGLLYWDEACFTKWLTNHDSIPNMTAYLPLLWRIFKYFAAYPFAERVFNNPEAPSRINEHGFVQAYSLLALNGVEILGTTKDGFEVDSGPGKGWNQKAPRLAATIFDVLKVSPSRDDPDYQPQGERELPSYAESHLMNAISLAGPKPYDNIGEVTTPSRRGVARRLLIDNAALNYETADYAVSSRDLQQFLQLFLMARLGDKPRKPGLMRNEHCQLTSNIEVITLVNGQEEAAASSHLAAALDTYLLKDAKFVPRQEFEDVCASYPNIVIRFYQLWTAICVPPMSTTTSQDLSPSLPNNIAQFLSLFEAAELRDDTFLTWNEDRRQLHLDFQNAKVIADSAGAPALDEPSLMTYLSRHDRFYLLLLSATESQTANEHLIALFTSPEANSEVPFYERSNSPAAYSWRYGFVQLLPQVLTAPTGGFKASSQDGAIRFSPHQPQNDASYSVVVDLKNGAVRIGLSENSVLDLTLKSLRCYRMPGDAYAVTRHPSKVPGAA